MQKILNDLENVISLIEELRAEMILANLDHRAESLLTIENDLIWQYQELSRFEVP